MRVGSLCTGYGGIELGLALAGETPDLAFIAETGPAAKVYDGTDVANLGDITALDWDAVAAQYPVDLLTAGFPCQPVSAAGRQLAEADARWLWPNVLDAIRALMPARVLLENVRNLISMRKGGLWCGILDDLAGLGYDVRWLTLGACAVGAAHHRHRVFALATWSPQRPDHSGAVERLDVAECGAKGMTLLPTPRASDGANGGPGQRGSSGDLAMPSAVQPANWGRFADAVARHAALYGDPPPPTEPNRSGAPRLSAVFAEWLMCLPAGHVTQALPLRREALAAIGNGVCPPQLAAAWLLLTGHATPVLDMSLGQSVASGAMTTTSEQVADLDARQADARARVLRAAFPGLPAGMTIEEGGRRVSAAMLELVAIWREQADWWEGSTRRGRQGKAKSLRDAAAELAGFAGGLTSVVPAPDPQAEVETGHNLCSHPAENMSKRADDSLYCTLCQQVVGYAVAEPLTADNFVPVVEAAHHQGDIPMQPMLPPVSASPFVAPGAFMESVTEYLAPETAAVNVPSPFATPAAPGRNRPNVKRLDFGDLGKLIADTYPVARPHMSHSYVEDMECCGLKALLSDASRHEVIGPRRPSWALVGGIAFHNAVEAIERAAIALGGSSPTDELGDWPKFWTEHLEAVVDETNLALAGTAYADTTTWHVPNKGMEGFDWWRVKGAEMVSLYVKHHDDAWRSTHTLLQVPAPIGEGVQTALTPVLEFAFDNTIGGTSIGSAGRVDAAWVAHPINGQLSQYPTAALEVIDFKSGARDPQSSFQMAEYADILRRHYLPANFALPVYGRHYLARKGIYTPPVLLDPQATTPEIAYRYTMAERGMRNGTFMANPSSFCSGCGLVDYCPTQRHRDG